MTQLVEVEVVWPRLRRAALAEMSRAPPRACERWGAGRSFVCRFPNCTRPVGWSDCDHVAPHATGGPTACTNLCCLCRSHHRLKTFARGWRFVMDPDGTLHVTTPAGITRHLPPPGLIGGRGQPPPVESDDPPPFQQERGPRTRGDGSVNTSGSAAHRCRRAATVHQRTSAAVRAPVGRWSWPS